ncbi:MAG: OmpA family protein [Myxococcales bacterium]|nr:OmpA family protein [Myxococcales bacterium]
MRRFASLLALVTALGAPTVSAQDFDAEFDEAPAPAPAPARPAPSRFDADFDDELPEQTPDVGEDPDAAVDEPDAPEATRAAPARREGPHDPWDRGEADARRFRMWNQWSGSTGGFRVADGRTGPAGTFRLQLGFEAFAKNGFLREEDSHSRIGGALSLTWSLHDLVEVYGGLVSYANSNARTFPNLLLVLSDINAGVKVGGHINDWLAIAGDVGLLLPTGSELGVGFAGMGVSLKVAATADLRGLPSPVPFLVRANLGYTFDRSARLIEDVEDFRYGQLLDPLPREDETRHFLSRVERYGLNVRRTDMLEIGVGVEIPLEISKDVYFSPMAEWTMGIPVNRQGFDCPFVPAMAGGDEPAPNDDDCLARRGVSAFPTDLTLGVRVLPPVRGLGFFLALDIGLTGTQRSNSVRELPLNEPWRIMFGLSYAHDTRDPIPPPDEITEREVVVEVPSDAPPRGRVRGRVVGREVGDEGETAQESPLGGAIVTFLDRDETSQIAGDDGTFVTYAFDPGPVTMEVRASGYQMARCEARIDDEGSDAEATCVLERALVQVEDQQVVILEQIQFAFDSDEILSESFPLMQQITNALAQNPQIVRVEIQGHTDDQGDYDYNARLSQRRAESVQRWLVEHGIDAERLRARGYGESRPLVRETTDEARARNRRVEFRILERSE